jgi:hypothetical protein
MAITYPLALPTTAIPKAIKFSPVAVVAQTVSPFTLQEEVFEHQGQMWAAQVQLPSMIGADGEAWAAWKLALNGSFGSFLMGDPVNTSPSGTGGGAPIANGAATTGAKEFNTKGWNPSETVLKAGDWIQLPNYRLHKILVDVVSDGGGDATLDIFPRLRDDLDDAAVLILSNTVGIWRMTDDAMTWDIGEAQIYGVNFSAREAL